MCVLGYDDIKDEISSGNLVISPFNHELLRPNSYDWTLDNTIFTADKLQVNCWNPHTYEDGEEVTFLPGEFYLCSTREKFTLSNQIMATITGRSSVGRLGMIEHLTAAHVDAEFDGHLTAEVVVLGPWPVVLRIGRNIGQVIFEYLRTPTSMGYGDFHGSKYMHQPPVPVPSRLGWEPE